MNHSEELDDNTLHWKLRYLGSKVRGLGFLIGLQQADPMPLEPAEEVYEGIGMVLDDLGRELIEIATKIDEEQVSLSKRSSDDEPSDDDEEDEDDD